MQWDIPNVLFLVGVCVILLLVVVQAPFAAFYWTGFASMIAGAVFWGLDARR